MTTISKKVVLITGANSGLGFQCGLALAKQPNFHVILAGRSQQRIDDAVRTAKAQAAPSSVVEGAIVDLASLADVRRFARALVDRDLQFFSIVCNAGVQLSHKTTTADGFEFTVGVNHTAHFLLLQLLRDRIKRIVMMSSETHDPTEVKTLKPLDMSDVRALAHGLEPYDTMQVYATSKLCNLLFTKEFARRFPDGPEILAYTPGFTPDTGLFREHNAVVRFLLEYVVGVIYRWSGGRTSTAAFSGGYMARLAAVDTWADNGWARGDYIRVDEVWPASAQACDPALGKALWETTEEWVQPFLH